MTKEEWKKIPGNPNYSVSNYGRVRNDVRGKMKALYPNNRGYIKIGLKGNKKHAVHRLVMLAFVGPSEMQVDHIDEVKTNNRLDNLRYLTGRLNTRRSVTLSKSGHHNIHFRYNRYQIIICVKGEQTYFGCCKTVEEAIGKRDKILSKLTLTDK